MLIENSTRSPSFVRSITMDKWFDDQLKKMEVHVACTVVMRGAFSNMMEYTHSWEETKGQESSLNLNPIIHLI